MEPIETVEFKYGIRGEIHLDYEPLNPRTEWDNLGTMVCWHRRYLLGDEQPREDPDKYLESLAEEADPTVADRIEFWEYHPTASVDHAEEKIQNIINEAIDRHYIMLPLYLYDHSGISISTGPFSCPWDSGQVGFIYITKAKAKEEFGWKILTRSRRKKMEEYLKHEVEEYDRYLTGEVYEFQITDSLGELLDTCGGFFDEEIAEEDMRDAARYWESKIAQELAEETQLEVEDVR